MNKKFQILANDFDERFVNGWKRFASQLIYIDDITLADPEIPLIIPANPLGLVGEWMAAKRPYISVNRPYLGSWLETKRFSIRTAVNSFACTKIGNATHQRWNTTRLEIQPWKVTEVKNILIAPSKKSQSIFTAVDPLVWAEQLKTFFESQGANVKVRPKVGKKGVQHYGSGDFKGVFGNDGDFEWADLVVSYSSAITCEAFWYGKKVISLGPCPTWVACDRTLDNWRDPIEPVNRNAWHEHISWVQFNYNEWFDGSAQEMTLHYQGHPCEVPHEDLFKEWRLPIQQLAT